MSVMMMRDHHLITIATIDLIHITICIVFAGLLFSRQIPPHSKNGYVMQNASLEFFVEVMQKFVILTEKFVILM